MNAKQKLLVTFPIWRGFKFCPSLRKGNKKQRVVHSIRNNYLPV